jgi:hypothetical protein
MGRIRDAVKAYEVVCGGRRTTEWWEIVDAIADALEPEEEPKPAIPDGWDTATDGWHCCICGKPAVIRLKDTSKMEDCHCGYRATPARCEEHRDVPYPHSQHAEVDPVDVVIRRLVNR